MKRVLVAAMFAAASAYPLHSATVSRAVEESLRRQPQVRVIALVVDAGDAESVRVRRDAAIAHSGATVLQRWDVVPGFSAVVDAAALDRLRHDPRVATIEDDSGGTFLGLPASSVPTFAPPRFPGYTGSGITVAVLDSGVRSDHPDLRHAVVAERCYCRDANNRPCCPNGRAVQAGPGAARDDFGHGTYVAAVIASEGTSGPRGVAPGSKLVAIRVADEKGTVTWTSQVISAIDWILRSRSDVRVVNMSFALGKARNGSCDFEQPAMAAAIARLRARGIVVVTATGNDGAVGAVRPPSCLSGVISVGALHPARQSEQRAFGCVDRGGDEDQVACFSNVGAALDLVAPGSMTMSSLQGKKAVSSTGTSFAAPQVAAAAAIMLEKNPLLTPEVVERLLVASGKPLVDNRTGATYRRLDLVAAVAATPPRETIVASRRQ